MASIRRSVGLTLSPEEFARLQAWAEAHRWKVAHAARVAVVDRLNAEEKKQEEAQAS